MANEDIKPDAPDVVAQESKTVGDENLTPREPTVEVHRDQVDAQVVQDREKDNAKVNVHEVSVQLDTVITDPSDPLAVQVPDAGRGSLDLPIHGLSQPTPEQVFSSDASSVEERSDSHVSASEPNPAAQGDGDKS